LLGAVRAAAPAAVLWTGDPPPGAARPGGGPVPLPEGRRDDLAYLLFTSGSTGVPKGVPITHDSVLTFATWVAGELGIGPDDRVSGHSALSFDFSVFDLYGAMAAGAALHLVPEHLNLVPDLLAGFIRESRLTQWSSVPSVMTAMAGRGVVRDFPDLRRVVWSGDVFPAPALRHWMLALPGVPFTNLFGPTETTVASCIATLSVPPGAADPIPIGRAVGGDRVALLDDDLRPVPAGTIGELYFAGAGLSPGYWRDPGATEQAFRVVDGTRWYRTGDLATLGPDGLYYFHGRRDRQVKSRGYRIELDEITAAAGRLTGVVAAAVVAVDAPGLAGRELCAAYVPAGGAALDPARLRAELSATLPTYMLPTRWLALDRLPVNTNGKIDHGAVVRVFEDVAAAPSHG
ncbi:AMP-binding protein, partial [Dactylosporangium sp. NPDC005572]|uniref:AMP-binding protein n=1 Tax=Dactylosporangium sp. NPDC005572 TaxID=3156889 RepID=UPI0033A7F1C7